ncbi:hypothetical protein SUDANB120_05626 [Streptomyces sp. enrichment culture]|uniref:hypothetical protein n=1 Tax=Streptomyces TaxID=1883 RepID=UPI0016794A55|nr:MULTISPECIES: hypothetical protein [Streptomyces]MBD3575779.1 hypothetical protein [Streptomyces sp. KD18]GGS82898.1 hypothetical protein GCM10010286_04480 [Streptomyces toxytricini]
MPDPHPVPPLAAVPERAPESGPEPGPLPRCPVCAHLPERISWRQQPGRPVVLAFDPCGHRHTSPAAPVLAVTPPRPPAPRRP